MLPGRSFSRGGGGGLKAGSSKGYLSIDFVVLLALFHFVIATTVAAGGRFRAWPRPASRPVPGLTSSLPLATYPPPCGQKKGREDRPWEAGSGGLSTTHPAKECEEKRSSSRRMHGLQLVGQAGPALVVPVTGRLRVARVLVVERRAVHLLAGRVAAAVAVGAVDGAVAVVVGAVGTADLGRLGRGANGCIDAAAVLRAALPYAGWVSLGMRPCWCNRRRPLYRLPRW